VEYKAIDCALKQTSKLENNYKTSEILWKYSEYRPDFFIMTAYVMISKPIGLWCYA